MPESIGLQLQHARTERGISLEEAAQATRIRLRYLQALEAEDFNVLPSAAQARGFLRNYASYLGLPDLSNVESLQIKSPPAGPVVEASPEKRRLAGKPLAPAKKPPARAELQNADLLGSPAAHTSFDPAGQPSQLIFIEIGETLQKQRELLSLSLEEVERYTHLRGHYLRAMEAGNIEGLPSPVQARGMLSNYARFLSLDSERVLNRYADGLQSRHMERTGIHSAVPGSQPAVSSRPALKRFLSLDLLFGGGMIVLLVSFVVWGASQIMALNAQESPVLTAPPISEVLQVTPSAMITQAATRDGQAPAVGIETSPFESSESTPETTPEAASLPPAREGEIQVYIISRQRSWMRVSVDQKVVFTGRTTPGGTYTYTGTKSIELTTGNAAGLQVFLNQNDLGSLGAVSEVVQLMFTQNGAVTPTPNPTATPTATPPLPATPTPSQTLQPSATPRSTIPGP